MPKEGGRFDLPIAIGILAAGGVVQAAALERREFYGELALGGELRETSKLLPALLHGTQCGHELILPASNLAEANLIGSQQLKVARNLREVVDALAGRTALCAADGRRDETTRSHPGSASAPDIADVRGSMARSAPSRLPQPASTGC